MPDARELIANRIRQRVRVKLEAQESELPYAPDHDLRDDKLLMHDTVNLLEVPMESDRGGRRGAGITWLRRHLKALLFPMFDQQRTHNETSTRISSYLLEQYESEGWLLARLEGKVDRAASLLEHLDGRIEFLEHERTAAVRLVGRHAVRDRVGPAEAIVEEGLRPLAAELADVEGRVVDVGCGRGEMLTVLGERGVDAYGVDLDLGMVSRCQERGLEVVRSDILAHLLELPDRTLGGLVAGGLAEEWPIVRLVSMLRAARRKLRPGGVLLLYGPDPLDPAGQSALADDPLALRGFGPDGLAALVEQEGFRAVRGSRVGSNYVVRASIT